MNGWWRNTSIDSGSVPFLFPNFPDLFLLKVTMGFLLASGLVKPWNAIFLYCCHSTYLASDLPLALIFSRFSVISKTTPLLPSLLVLRSF